MKKLGKNRKTLVRVAIGLILTLIFGFSSFVGFLGEKRSTEGESNLSLLGDARKTQSNQDIEDFNPENNVLLSAYGTLEATDAVLFLNYETVLGTVTGTVNGVETDFIIGEEGNVLAPGATVVLNASSKPGAAFIGWSLNGLELVSLNEQYTLTVSEYVTVFAVFMSNDTAARIGAVGFETLEEALDSASPGDYVILVNDYTMETDASVRAGVTLLLPVDRFDTTGYTSTGFNPDGTKTKSGDLSVLYRTLNIPKGVTLTIHGTVIVNAVTGRPGGGNLDQEITGNYSRIVLDGMISVESGGLLDVFGRIIGSGLVEAKNGSSVGDLYIVRCWRGGSKALLAVIGGVYPYNQYDMHNIEVDLKIQSNASYYGNVKMYADGEYHRTRFYHFDQTHGLIRLSPGAEVLKTFDAATGQSTITIRGGAEEIGGSMNYGGQSASTKDYFYPIDGDIHFVLEDGLYVINNKIKFLTGSSLVVKSNATLEVKSEASLILYQTFNDVDVISGTKYPLRDPVVFELYGTIDIQGTFGGYIDVVDSRATVIVGNGADLRAQSKELTGDYFGIVPKTATISVNTNIRVFPEPGYQINWYWLNNGVPEFFSNAYSGGKEYYNLNDKSNKGKTFLVESISAIPYQIKYENMSGAVNHPDNPATYTIEDTIILNTPEKAGYTFQGWFLDSGLTQEITQIEPGRTGNITLYAKWDLNAPIVDMTGYDRPVTYGQPVELIAEVQHGLSSFTFQWYKDGEILPGKTGSSLSISNVSESGLYKVLVTVSDGKQSKSAEASQEVVINKAVFDLSGISFADQTFVYNGNNQWPTLSGTLPEGISVNYVGSGRNVGTYTVTAVFVDEKGNYEPIPELEATLTVVPLTAVISFSGYEGLVYDGTEKTVTASITNLVSGDDVSLVLSGNKQTNAGAYVAEVVGLSGSNSGNYQLPATGLSQEYTIAKATVTGISFESRTYVFEEGTSRSLSISGVLPEGVNVSYNWNGETQETPFVFINAGTYVITASFTVSSNYNEIPSLEATLTIEKADPDIVWPVAGSIYVGQSLSESVLSGGSASVSGVFVWKNPEIKPASGTNSFLVAFIPEDSNYISLEGEVEVEAIQLTVTFNDDSGDRVINVDFGATLPVSSFPEVAQRLGYTGSWDVQEDIENITSSKTVVAIYELINYSITYELNGGFVSGENPTSYNVLSDSIQLANPTKAGHVFAGWTGTNISEPTVEVVIPAGSTGDLHFVANWIPVFILSVRSENEEIGYVEVNVGEEVPFNSSVTIKAHPYPGYYFLGWFVGDAKIADVSEYTFTMPEQDYEIVARFSPRNDIDYTVEHYLEQLDGTFLLQDSEVLKGTTGTLVQAVQYEYEGFAFDESITGSQISGYIQGDGSLVLKLFYARNNYDVIFAFNNGDVDLVVNAKYESTINLPIPSKAGYDFLGWLYQGNVMKGGSAFAVPSQDAELIAQWTLSEPTVSISGYTGPVTYGKTVSLTANAEHALSGLSYQWYKLVDGTYQLLAGKTTNKLNLVYVSDSGTYKVVVSISDGVETKSAEAVHEVVINKAQGLIIADTVQIHRFDGQTYTLAYTLNNEQVLKVRDNLPISYSEPGAYTIRVYAEESANYLTAPEVEITIIIAVAVIGEEYYGSIAEAVENAVSGDTILVIADAVVDTEVIIKPGVTLTIAYNDEFAGAALSPEEGIKITGSGQITVKDGGRIIEPVYFVMDSPAIFMPSIIADLAQGDFEILYKEGLKYPNFFALTLMTFVELQIPYQDFPFFPFDTYHMRSILVDVFVEYGGTYDAKPLFISPTIEATGLLPDRFNLMVPSLVTSRKDYDPEKGGLVVLEEGSSFKKQLVSGGKIRVTIDGDAFIGNYPVTIQTLGLGAIERFPFAISENAEIEIQNGNLVVNSDFLLRSGATLEILPGSSLVNNATIVVEEGAAFTVNGSLIINGTFIGIVDTDHKDAEIIISEGATLASHYYDPLLYILYCLKMDIRNWNDPDALKYSSDMSYNDFLSILQDETDNLNKWILFFAITSAWDEFNDEWGMKVSEVVEILYIISDLFDFRDYIAQIAQADDFELLLQELWIDFKVLPQEYHKTIADYIHYLNLSTSNLINNGLGLGFVAGKTYVSDYDGNEYVWKQLFNVQFVDDDGTVLKEEIVKFGDDASAPDLPERIGYTSNWSVSWQDIQGDTVITVVYELDEPVIKGISTDAVDDTVTYGTSITLTVSATHPLGGLTYQWYKDGILLEGVVGSSLTLNNVAESGVYHVIVTITVDGKTKSVSSPAIEVTINRKEIDLSGVELNDFTVIYNGELHKFDPLSELPEGVIAQYFTNNEITNVGSVTVSLTLTADSNYIFNNGESIFALYATITVIPLAVAVDWVHESNYVYNGLNQSGTVRASYVDVLGQTVVLDVTCSGEFINAGTYTFTAVNYNENYALVNPTLSLTIEKAASVISAEDMTVTYDGTAHSIEATLNHGESELVYENNGQVNAGVYIVVIRVDESTNYLAAEIERTLTINRKEIDLSGVELNDLTVKYNGELHKFDPLSELPEGVIAQYFTNNEITNVGSVTVSLTLTADSNYIFNNGESIFALYATITVIPLDVAVDWVHESNYVYNGLNQSGTVRASYVDVLGQTVVLDVTCSGEFINAGTYTFTAVNYNENYALVNPTLSLTIEKAASVISAEDMTVTYDGTAHSIEATLNHGESELVYENNGQVNAGVYTVVIRVAESTNYLAAEIKRTLTINRKEIDLSGVELNDLTVKYNGELHKFDPLSELPEGVIAQYFTNNEITNVGSVTVSLTLTADSNYIFNNGESIFALYATITVIPLDVAVDWVHESNYVYNGLNQSGTVRASYVDVLGQTVVLDVTCSGEFINAGTYTFTAVNYNENYALVNPTLSLTIEKAASVISAEDMTVTYDGTAHSIEATLNHGESELVYENNGQVNAGVYTVVIRVAESTNYLTAEIKRTLTINRKEIDLSGVELNDFTVIYNGELHKFDPLSELPEGVIAQYFTNNEITNVGSVTVSLTLTADSNYIFNNGESIFALYATITVIPLDVAVDWVHESNYVYNGLNQSGTVSASYVDVLGQTVVLDVTCSGEFINAGTYTFTAVNYNENYALVNPTLSLTIEKAASVISAEDMTVTYDGTAHSIEATLNHGESELVYENNGQVNAGVYTVVIRVAESTNYLTAEIKRTLTIDRKEIDLSGVELNDFTVIYNGELHKFDPLSELPEGVIAQYFTNNEITNVGSVTVSLTLTADSNYIFNNGESIFALYATITVIPLDVAVDWVHESNYVYNGLNQSGTVSASYVDVLGQTVVLDVTCSGEFINAGTYTFTAVNYNENYALVNPTLSLTIEKAASVISAEDMTVTYDGTAHSIEATLNHGESELVYENNGQVNAGVYTVVIRVAESTNYLTAEIERMLTINPRPVQIVVDDKSSVYGEELAELTHSIIGLVSGDQLVVNLTKDEGLNAGEYAIIVTYEPNPNYTVSVVEGTYTIKKAASVISAEDMTVTYDGTAHSIEATLNHGESELVYENNGQVNAGVYTVVIRVAESTNYLAAEIERTLTINRKEIDLSGVELNDFTVIYNGELHKFDPLSELPEGVIAQYFTNNGITNVGSVTVSLTLTADSNYIFNNGESIFALYATITVIPLAVAVDWVHESNYVYNGLNQSGTVRASYVDVLGQTVVLDVTCSGEFINAGTYTFTAVNYNENYALVNPTLSLTIEKAASVISAEDMTVTYDGTAHSIEATLNHGESELVYENNGQVNAGVYTVVIRVDESTNYLAAEIERMLTINPRPVQIVVDDKSSVYGEELAELTHSIIGLVSGDQLVVNLTKDEGLNAGEYAIIVTYEPNPNYTVSVVEGTYTIKKAASVISAEDMTVTYDGTAHSIEATLNHGESELVYENNGQVNAGVYTVVIRVDESTNYLAAEIERTLTINRKEIDLSGVELNDLTVIYNGELHKFDPLSELPEGVIAQYFTNNGITNVGSVTVSLTLTADSNYIFNNGESIFALYATITVIPLDVAVDWVHESNYVYNGLNQSGTVSASYVDVLGQTVVLDVTCSGEFINAGTYTFTAVNYNENYALVNPTLSLTIEKAASVISAEDMTVTYDGTAHSIEATLNHDESELVYENNGQVNAGVYTVVIRVDESTNYLAAEIERTLTINRKEIDLSGVELNDFTVIYNGELHKFDPLSELPEGVIAQYFTNNEITNVGSVTVSLTLTADSNYIFNNGESIFALYATITVIPLDVAVDWVHESNYVYNGLNQSGTVSASYVDVLGQTVVLDVTCSGEFINAGTYTFTAVNYNENYALVNPTLSLTIEKAASVISAEDMTVTYDGTAHSIEATLNHDESELVYENNGQVNAGVYTVVIRVDESTNYLAAEIERMLTINPRPVQIVVDDKSSVYGEELAELTHSIIGLVSGDQLVVNLTKDEGLNAGEYAIIVTYEPNPNYEIEVVEGTYTIKKAASVISAEDMTVTYDGTAHSIEATLNHDESELVYENNGQVNAGVYTVVIRVAESTNYLAAEIERTLTINRKEIDLSGVELNDFTVIYNGELHKFDPLSELPEGVIAQYFTNNEITNVGSVTVSLTLTADSNYIFNNGESIFALYATITVIPLDVAVDWVHESNYVYNGLNQSGTVSASYVDVLGQTVVLDVTCSGEFINAGTYTFTAVNYNENYALVNPTLSLTIEKAASVISAEDMTVTYDGTAHSIEATLNQGESELVYENNGQVNAGVYTVVIRVDESTNYLAAEIERMLTINPRPVQIVVDDKSSVYGEELAELTHSIIGLVSGDQLVVNLTKDEGLNAGEYAIIVTYEPNPNYTVSVVEGTYTIKKAASVISAEDMTVTYDGTAHSIEATLNHGESELVYENNGQVNAGVYTVVIRVDESTNYLAAEIERTLTINPRPVQIVVDDKSSVFGEPLLSLTYSVVGLVGDDTLIVVLSKEEGISVGEYAITAIFEQNPNYSVTVVEGVYRIVVDEQKLAQLIQLLGNLNFDDIFGEYDNLVSIGDLIDEIGEENISENYLEAYHEAIEVFNNYVETANQELEEAIAVGSIITRRFDIVTAVRALFALTSTIIIGAFFFARRKFFRG